MTTAIKIILLVILSHGSRRTEISSTRSEQSDRFSNWIREGRDSRGQSHGERHSGGDSHRDLDAADEEEDDKMKLDYD